ncbi:MAG: hypothetical protein ACREUQ_05605 [Burkholderiales bacterium]
MLNDSSLKVPKSLAAVTLWVHPEGRVQGSMFVNLPGPDSTRAEQPWDVINEPPDFIAIKREDPEEVRFYNKSSIVRIQYWDGISSPLDEGRPLPCQITMMDGSLINGKICKAAPIERSRLYDYMNETGERFLKLRPDSGGEVLLVNKSYVVYISTVEARERASDASESKTASPCPLAPVA